MIIDDEIRIELTVDGEGYDISHLLLAGSLHVQEILCNAEYKSTLNSASWSISWDDKICSLLKDSSNVVSVMIWHGQFFDVLFDGQMDPVFTGGWEDPDHPDSVSLEAVDFSVALDKGISQSVSFPAEVDGFPFFIYKRSHPELSILHKLLEIAGLSDRISPSAPDIVKQIIHIAATEDEVTYRDLIDPLLSEYRWVLAVVDGDKIGWSQTAFETIGNVEVITEKDILAGKKLSLAKRYDTHDGVLVEWPQTKVVQDALVWRGNLPVGDTADPTPGEPIAAGDYWPEDSDIVETWMDFASTFLDTKYLTGASRLQNENLGLIASSNHYIDDIKDDGVELDPISIEATVIYESLRARLRYKNTGAAALRLYWSEIYGKALVQDSLPETKFPIDCTDPEIYPVSHIFDDDSAKALVEALWTRKTKGCFDITFPSLQDYPIGAVRKLSQGEKYDGYILITGRSRSYDFSGKWLYTAVSIAAIESVAGKTINTLKSGPTKLPKDGNSSRPIYTRSAALPATPVGPNPSGWSTVPPEGSAPLWMSFGVFSSTGDQVGEWTVPIRVSGIDKAAYFGMDTSDPENPADGDFYLYTGTTQEGRTQYHYYQWSAASGSWSSTTDSNIVMAGWKDALQLAKDTGEVVFAAMLVLDILIANKLNVGGGTLTTGLLFRVLDDDGNGNTVIEARYNGNKVWWIDTDTGKMYGNFAEIRNVLPFQFEDSLDSSHPFEVDFFIPSDTVRIASVKLNAKGVKYRAYSTSLQLFESDNSTREGGVHSHALGTSPYDSQTGEAPDHTHGYTHATGIGGYGSGSHSHELSTSSGSTGSTSAAGDYHSHSVTQATGVSGSGTHDHSLSTANDNTSGAGKHSHSYSKPTEVISGGSHTHTFSMNHDHSFVFGIFEGTIPESVSLYCDNGSGYGSAISLGSSAILASELDLSDYFTGTGWKRMKFTSSKLGRIVAQLILQVDITV